MSSERAQDTLIKVKARGTMSDEAYLKYNTNQPMSDEARSNMLVVVISFVPC